VPVCSKHSHKRPIRLQHTRTSLPRSTHVAAIVIYGVTLPGPFKRDTGKFPKIARRGCNLHISKALLSSRGPILASVSPLDPKSSREASSRFRMPARPLDTQCVSQYLSIMGCATRSERRDRVQRFTNDSHQQPASRYSRFISPFFVEATSTHYPITCESFVAVGAILSPQQRFFYPS